MSWRRATVRQIARAVRRGDAAAATMLAEHVPDTDDACRAFTVLRARTALAEAGIVDELPDLASLPLAGVPVAVCEQFAVAGQPTRRGSAAATSPTAASDDETVRRMRGAGSVVLGTTRSSELGLWAGVDDGARPLTNPWRVDRAAAGPSAGAALAVASGAVPLSVGVDGPGTAGGVRTAAAACGLVAVSLEHDPQSRRVSPGDWLAGLPGVLATTVQDAAECHAVLTRSSPRRIRTPPRLRVAASDRPLLPVPGLRGQLGASDSDTVKSLLDVVRALTAAGHDTHRAVPSLGPRAAGASFNAWSTAACVRSESFSRGRMQRRTRRLAAVGERTSPGREPAGLLGDGARTRVHALDWFDSGGFDVLVTPASAGPPPAAETWSTRSFRDNVRASGRAAAFTAVWGLIGLPAMVVPVGERPDGLPATVQLVAPPGGAGLLFDVAAQLTELMRPRRYAPALRAAAGA